MHRIILLLLVLCIYAHPVSSQDSPQEKIGPMYGNQCSNPDNADRWVIREPLEEEIQDHGSGILIFEYWNSTAQCSDQITTAIYLNDYRFMLEVIVGISANDSREEIILDTLETPYYLPIDRLLLDDGEEPGSLILYPMIM